jgi:hypothetical protein
MLIVSDCSPFEAREEIDNITSYDLNCEMTDPIDDFQSKSKLARIRMDNQADQKELIK